MRPAIFVILAYGAAIGYGKPIHAFQGPNEAGLVPEFQLQDVLKNDYGALEDGKEPGSGNEMEQLYDGQDIADAAVLSPQRRGVGWQPLKRSGVPSSSLQLGFNDPANLQKPTFDAVDQLLRDLVMARKYGIEPEKIVEDFRTRHSLH